MSGRGICLALGTLTVCTLGLLVALPAASATSPGSHLTITAEPDAEDERLLEPGGEQGTWTWTIEYRTNTPPVDGLDVHLEAAVSHLDARVHPETVTLGPKAHVDGPPGPMQTYTTHGTLTVSASVHASAYVAQRVDLCAWTDQQPPQEDHESCTMAVAMPSWRPQLDLQQETSTLTVDAGEQAHVRPTLVNRGNGDASIVLQEVHAPASCTVEPIHDELVLSKYTRIDAVLHVACEDPVEGTLEAVFEQRYAPDLTLQTDTATATWELTIEDDDEPAKATMLGLGLAAASLGLARVARVR